MVPWYVKIPLKMALSRLPVPRETFNRLGIFRHGSMVRPDYALEIMQRHIGLAGIDLSGRRVLELGPGDSVGNGIIAYAFGAESSCLVDAGDWAVKTMHIYKPFVAWLKAALPDATRLIRTTDSWQTFPQLLETFHIGYLTQGLDSLRSMPDASIDYCFSEAVLEHIRVHEFGQTIAQVRRVMATGAVASHVIDYKDHLQAGLNSMRFSRASWESRWFADSGFYTNRLRHSDVLSAFTAAGFEVLQDQPTQWARLPTPIKAIHPELSHYTESVLRVREASIVVRIPN